MNEPKHAIVPLAPGFEEIEAVAIIDILRRAGVRVTVAGLGGGAVTGSHGIRIECDARVEECDAGTADAVCLPGGMPGAAHLRESADVGRLLAEASEAGRLLAAVCAGPTVLNAAGLLEGRRATSHPAHQNEMDRCIYAEDPVVEDGNVITSRGAGTAIEFAAAVVRRLVSGEAADEILRRIEFPR
jgi:4-methyl-5(b-hydroxyethyl)-thiazole monophosphate biosynthesis